MGRTGYRTSGLGFRDKFVTYAMQPEFLDIGIGRLIEHHLECAMKRAVRGRGRARDLVDRQGLIEVLMDECTGAGDNARMSPWIGSSNVNVRLPCEMP
jgi:hypothetical protein